MHSRFFQGCKTLDEVKALYKQLALIHHPDRGGDTGTMQAINAQYDAIRKDPHFKFWKEKEEVKLDFTEFPDIINKIIAYRDLTIELCGNWLWVSGNTKRHKDVLKKAGFFYANEKKFWYWRPHDYKSANRKPLTIENIRRKYGSDIISPPHQHEIEEVR